MSIDKFINIGYINIGGFLGQRNDIAFAVPWPEPKYVRWDSGRANTGAEIIAGARPPGWLA